MDLPKNVTLADAVSINERCQVADGIERIDMDGTVHFCDWSVEIMKRMLGYECRVMRLDESLDRARELGAKYQKFAAQVSVAA